MSEVIAEAPAEAPQVEAPVSQDPSPPEVKQDEQVTQDTPKEEAKEELVPVKRIHRMRAALGDKERQLQEAQKKLADYEAKLASVPLDDKPKAEDFDTPEDYADKLADWKLAQKDKESAQAQKKEETVEEVVAKKLAFKEKELSFRAQEDNFRKQTPDYDAKVAVVNDFIQLVDPNHPSTQAFATALLNSDKAAKLLYHLGENPQEIMAMMKMSPYEIEDKMSDLVDRFNDAPAQGVTQEQQAPEATLPPPPNALKGTTRGTKSIDQMSGQELLDYMAAKGKKQF